MGWTWAILEHNQFSSLSIYIPSMFSTVTPHYKLNQAQQKWKQQIGQSLKKSVWKEHSNEYKIGITQL